MSEYVLLGKVIIAVLMVGLCYGALRRERVREWLSSYSWRTITLAFVGSRLAVFLILFVVLHLPAQSDVGVYLEQARSVAAGQRAFIDVPTAYGPWFIVITARAVRLWNSGSVLVLLSILFEFAAWPLWIRLIRGFMEEREVKLTAWIYLASPLPFLNVPMVGMNHVWLATFLGLAMLWQQRGRSGLAGLAMGASIVVVKFLSLLWVPLLFWQSRQKVRWMIGFALLPLIAYGMLAMQGADLMAQVKMHAHYDSSGNLPYLFGITGIDASMPAVRNVFNLLGMAGLSIAFCICVLKSRLSTARQLLFALPLFMIITLLLSKKSFSSYLEIVMFPLAALIVIERTRWWSVAWFTVLMLTTSLEPSLWFRWLRQAELRPLLYGPANGHQANGCVVVFLVIEALMLASYIFMASRLWQQMRPSLEH